MSDIDLSIIVPCYNCETTIDEAIESITKYSYPFTYEIILVVVKASSDNSLKTCQELNTLDS